tara:strand:- start:34815 stop:35138 length:324 start_codon:yes stop_codon:yes gene_type:complete
MAKRQRTRSSEDSEVEETPKGFQVSKTKVGKPTLVTVTFQLTELQECHLDNVAKENETSRAELCKQAVAHCLTAMEQPFPEVADEEMQEKLEERRSERKIWAARRGK